MTFKNLFNEYRNPIELILTPTTISFKDMKTMKHYDFECNLIETAECLDDTCCFTLCLKLRNIQYYFNGFANSEFEKISKYFENSSKIIKK